MSYKGQDDEYDEDENEYDEDAENEEDDDDEQLASRRPASANPFTTSGSGYGSSRPPGATSPPPKTNYGNPSRLPGSPGSGSSSSLPGGTRPTYGSNPSSPTSPGAPRPTYGGSSPASPGGTRSTYGNNPSSPSSPSSPGAPRPTYGSSPSSPSSPSSQSSPYGASRPATGPLKPGGEADKGKQGQGGLGGVSKGLSGITSRFGGGDKENKPATPKSGGGNPLSKGLSGITSRFGSGDKDNRPATSKSGGGNPLSKGLSSITSRFGGNKPQAKSPTSSASSSSMGGTASRSAFGSGRPGVGSSPSASSGARTAGAKVGFAERLKGSLPFLGGKETRRTPSVREKAERASKAPRVDQAGLSLDNKLDILGVVLLLGSLALFFSSMSATKGQLTEAVNTFLAQLLGWGAIAVPVVMFAVGLWLIVRHFGDEAPVIQPVRIVGIITLYVGALVLFQYVESFNELYKAINPADLNQLKLQLNISSTLGRGGGWLGAQLYYLLVTNITEYGMVVTLIGTLLIGIMLVLRISAAEMAVFFISIGRSFVDARRRRTQERAAAARLAAAQQAQITAQQISVSKPVAGELPAAKPPALPAATTPELPLSVPLAEPRPIPITMGGKTVTAFFDNSESVPLEAPPALPAATAQNDKTAAGKPSFAARILSAVPGSKSASGEPKNAPAPAKSDDQKGKSGGLLGGRLFNRTSNSPAPVASQPAAPIAAPGEKAQSPLSPLPTAPAASAATTRQSHLPAPSAASPFKLDAEDESEDGEPMRLGDLIRPPATPAASTSTPASRPSLFDNTPGTTRPPLREAIKPFGAEPSKIESIEMGDEDDEDEELADLRPATPKGTGTLPRPENIWSKSAAPSPPLPTPTSGANGGAGESLAERRERLNALRNGQVSPATTSNSPVATPGDNKPTTQPMTPAASVPTPARPASQSAYPADEVSRRPNPVINVMKDENGVVPPRPAAQTPAPPVTPAAAAAPPAFKRPDTPPVSPGMPIRKARKNWKLPDYKTLLNPGSESDMDRETLLARARTIEETLQSFGAPGRVVEVNTGPVITQFGVEPDYLVMRSGKKNRVKVGAIAQLDKDLQLSLGAKSIRIEAPVPGKGYVGIEVPNEQASIVSLRDVMDSDEFKKIRAKSPLAIALGQSVDGAPIAADLGSMPHLLVAGTTGSGKSVLVNAIIGCLILSNTPDKVKFIMVDPKRVELTGYNGIPHLVAPVVVDLERIVGVLKWVTREMDERYKQFSNAGARNIEDFNKHLAPDQEQMPYIIVIIDELADLMMLAPDETERVVTRIAALARATGIHLVIATQRPSVDVVTGLIKANFPARIAFAVAGGVDSRVILDQPGAEKLLGRGDMLYLSGDSPAALRLQGVYLSDTEINNITRYWKMFTAEDEPARPITALALDDEANERPRDVMPRAANPIGQQAFWEDDSPKSINGNLVTDDDDEDLIDGQDELYEQAVDMVRRLNKASVSLLQRRLRIGYTRAARLIDMMEEQGIVGPAQEGSKPREVLPTKD